MPNLALKIKAGEYHPRTGPNPEYDAVINRMNSRAQEESERIRKERIKAEATIIYLRLHRVFV